MLNLDMPLIVLFSIPAGFLIAYLGIVLRTKLLKNDLLAKIILIILFIGLSIASLIFFVDLNNLANLDQKSFEEAYPGLSIYLVLFPAAILYNFLVWKNIGSEIGPSKESFPLWIYQRGLVFYLLGFLLFINYLESLIEIFSIASGAGALILSIGIPVAIGISLVKIALEDLNKWRSEKDRLENPFQTKLKPLDLGSVAEGSQLIFVYDNNSRLSQDIDQVLSELAGDVYSLNIDDYPDFAVEKGIGDIPALVALNNGEVIFASIDNYSKTQLKFNLKKARRQIDIASLSSREKETEKEKED